jgi:hypothetical protein
VWSPEFKPHYHQKKKAYLFLRKNILAAYRRKEAGSHIAVYTAV